MLRPRLIHISYFILFLLLPTISRTAAGEEVNYLLRVDSDRSPVLSRVSFSFSSPVEFSKVVSPGKTVLVIKNAVAGNVKEWQRTAGSPMKRVAVRRQGLDLAIAITLADPNHHVRVLDQVPCRITLDIGPLQERVIRHMPQGRERILLGAERFIRDYAPPLASRLPFTPSDADLLRKLHGEAGMRLFIEGEAALYRGKASEAAEIFGRLAAAGNGGRGQALWRLGESLYFLQEYKRAYAVFCQAERLSAQDLPVSLSSLFCYADTVARCGDFEAGRRRMAGVVARLAETGQAPFLLVRMGEMAAREGRTKEAERLWSTVARHFPRHTASLYAALNLADLNLFSLDCDRAWRPLRLVERVQANAEDRGLKEEVQFKSALLNSLYGTADEGLSAVVAYDRRYPRGVYSAIVRSMREDLLLVRFRELKAAGDCAGLMALAQEHRDYLARCFTDDSFSVSLSACFVSAGRHQEERNLFTSLLEREWSSAQVPFLLIRIFEDDLLLTDDIHAEWAAEQFLARFPGHPQQQDVQERLGRHYFEKNDFKKTASLLLPLLGNAGPPERAESLYYLGRSLLALHDPLQAEVAVKRYLALAGQESPMVSEAWWILAAAREEVGDLEAAASLYGAGLLAAKGESADRFMYKIGHLSRRLGKSGDARSWWARLDKEGKDPVWRLLAVTGLTELASEEFFLVSK